MSHPKREGEKKSITVTAEMLHTERIGNGKGNWTRKADSKKDTDVGRSKQSTIIINNYNTVR